MLRVRSEFPGHIEELFPDAVVRKLTETDDDSRNPADRYPYEALIAEGYFLECFYEYTDQIDGLGIEEYLDYPDAYSMSVAKCRAILAAADSKTVDGNLSN